MGSTQNNNDLTTDRPPEPLTVEDRAQGRSCPLWVAHRTHGIYCEFCASTARVAPSWGVLPDGRRYARWHPSEARLDRTTWHRLTRQAAEMGVDLVVREDRGWGAAVRGARLVMEFTQREAARAEGVAA